MIPWGHQANALTFPGTGHPVAPPRRNLPGSHSMDSGVLGQQKGQDATPRPRRVALTLGGEVHRVSLHGVWRTPLIPEAVCIAVHIAMVTACEGTDKKGTVKAHAPCHKSIRADWGVEIWLPVLQLSSSPSRGGEERGGAGHSGISSAQEASTASKNEDAYLASALLLSSWWGGDVYNEPPTLSDRHCNIQGPHPESIL